MLLEKWCLYTYLRKGYHKPSLCKKHYLWRVIKQSTLEQDMLYYLFNIVLCPGVIRIFYNILFAYNIILEIIILGLATKTSVVIRTIGLSKILSYFIPHYNLSYCKNWLHYKVYHLLNKHNFLLCTKIYVCLQSYKDECNVVHFAIHTQPKWQG